LLHQRLLAALASFPTLTVIALAAEVRRRSSFPAGGVIRFRHRRREGHAGRHRAASSRKAATLCGGRSTTASNGDSTMRIILATSGVIAGLLLLTSHIVQAQDARSEIEGIVKEYIESHPDEVGQIVKEYLVKHPEAVGEIMVSVLKHRPAGAGVKDTAMNPSGDGKAGVDDTAIAANAATLFSSPHQVILGNPNGDVTLVEFFDYSCGFCKRALADTLALIKDDPNLKIVLKEFPILGPGSAEAARVAIAVRMQDLDRRKYLAFHQELLGSPGPASKEKALTAAKDQGLDMARLELDMASAEINATLGEDAKLAGALGIRGTPGYVIGDKVVRGAVGVAALKAQIETARGHGVN
jgi:protein-disulfide isomerase